MIPHFCKFIKLEQFLWQIYLDPSTMDKGGQEINWRTWLEDGGKWTLYAKHFCDFFTKKKQ